MGKGKRIRRRLLFILIGVAAVSGIFAGVGIVAKSANATTVKVIPVSELNQGYFDEGQGLLYGEVAASVTQKVELIDDAIISQVYVKVGDRVKPGDKLLTYDMTLKQLEVELYRLQKQDLENKLAKAQSRLESLENGGPITESEEDEVSPEEDGALPEEDEVSPEDDGDGDEDDGEARGPYLRAFSQLPLRVAAAIASGQGISSSGHGASASGQEPSVSGQGSSVSGQAHSISGQMSPVLYELLDYSSVPYRGSGSEEDPYCFLCTGSEDGVVVKGSFFNKMAGYNEEGTQLEEDGEASWYRLEFHKSDRIANLEDPSQSLLGYYVRRGGEPMDPDEERYFTLEGAVSPDDGEEVLTPGVEPTVSGPNVTVPEEKKDTNKDTDKDKNKDTDKDTDKDTSKDTDKDKNKDTDKDKSKDTSKDTSKEDQAEDDGWEDDDWEDDGWEDDGWEDDDWEDDDWEDDSEEEDLPEEEESAMSREEAIKYQKNTVQSYELDIQKKALAISELEKELEKETITSTMEGIVTVVGNPDTGESDGDGFIEIESDDGYYIKGGIGEMMLGQLEVGDIITGDTYETGLSFTAEIREIASYPSTESDDAFENGMGNPNVSYYPFVAHVIEDLELENEETVELTLDQDMLENSEAIYLDPAMVRSEGSQYYVYKDEKGVLKKQNVTASKSSDGYSVIVTGGLTNDDKIAFPYGTGVEEGAKTEEGTSEDLYGDYGTW